MEKWVEEQKGLGRSQRICMTAVRPVSLRVGQFDDFFHRNKDWFGLEGTFKGHLVQPPCTEQHLQLDQVAPCPTKVTLSVSRDEAATTSLGSLCQCLTS